VTLVAEAGAPAGVAEVRFRAQYGGSVHDIGSDADGSDGWQMDWDCQDVPDGAATLSLGVIDRLGQAVIADSATTPVTLSKDCADGTYRTAFFANPDLAGSPASSWCKATGIGYNWGAGSPGAGVMGADNFSARFRGDFSFEAGAYEFSGNSDDGFRVWIDGSLQYDAWYDHASAGAFRFVRLLSEGRHEVRVDYYERTDLAAVAVAWARTASGFQTLYLPVIQLR
ncbi:MAG: PA14 domain-containing protein, partial [Bacteroidota bacterium]